MRSKPVPLTEKGWEELEAQRIAQLPFFTDHPAPSRNQRLGQTVRLQRRLISYGDSPEEALQKAHSVINRAVAIHDQRTKGAHNE